MTSLFSFAFREPVLLYQKNRTVIENTLTAAALTYLVALFFEATKIYPDQWRTVLLVSIFVVGAQWRDWGYYLAFAALLWPLWNLSPYLMTLFVAVGLLPRYWLIQALPWVLLVMSAPILAEWQILGLAPLLAGLVAGPKTGWWTGIFCALWLKLIAGMSGLMPELGALHGLAFSISAIELNFVDASSLETLERLAEPFAQSSFLLLLHLLQIAAWGLAGWIVGSIKEKEWRKERPFFMTILTLTTGFLILWSGLYLLPAWLELQSLATFLSHQLPTIGLALSALSAGLLATLYESMQRPVPPKPMPYTEPLVTPANTQATVDTSSTSSRPWSQPARPKQDDLIMLELD